MKSDIFSMQKFLDAMKICEKKKSHFNGKFVIKFAFASIDDI